MRTLNDPSWDIQYSADAGAHIVNFGWFYVKSNKLCVQLWESARERYMLDQSKWDQQIVQDTIQAFQMSRDQHNQIVWKNGTDGITMVELPRQDFFAWHTGIYQNSPSSVMDHLTAVWTPHRFWVARESAVNFSDALAF